MMSIIVSFHSAEEQVPHRDIPSNFAQIICALKDGTRPTNIYCPDYPNISSWQSASDAGLLQDLSPGLLQDVMTKHPSEVPTHIRPVAEDCMDMFKEYGATLNHVYERICIESTDLVAGEAIIIPGKAVHAGPKTHGFRAIIFAAGRDTDDACGEDYDGNAQYSRASFTGILLEILNPYVSDSEKIILFREMVVSCRKERDLDIVRGQGELCEKLLSPLTDTDKKSRKQAGVIH
jgi:hypothetical protein